MRHRVFYAAGPGNIIAAHRYSSNGEHDPTEVSITFSSQVEDCCRNMNSSGYFVSYKSPPQVLIDGQFTFEHRPKPMPKARGLKYHYAELLYGVGLVRTARKFKATVAVLDSGTSHFFMGMLFRLSGIPVVTVLHNTIWPSGFRPTKPLSKLIQQLDALFFRWGSSATIGVSPECNRQVEQLTNGRHQPLYQIRAQFLPSRFEPIGPPPIFDGSKLRIMYVGRINKSKGLFDILEMAKKLNEIAPNRVEWEICGSGPDLDLLKARRSQMGLENVILRGWVSLEQLQEVYSRSHISIVPTRSDFAEGLAMTAAEAILSGRPVLTNPVVPALEILGPACLEAKTNNIDSYVEAICSLLHNPNKYGALCGACPALKDQFYDRSNGLTAVLTKVLAAI